MGKGRRYELDLANELSDHTTDDVQVDVADYSGNSKSSFSDINVYHPKSRVENTTKSCMVMNGDFIEVKKSTADRGYRDTVFSGSSDGDSGFDELKTLIENTPEWGTPRVVISWDNCKPIVMNGEKLRDALTDDDTTSGPPFFDARLTNASNISFRKPTLDEWMSSQSAVEDWQVVAKEIGVALEYYDAESMSNSSQSTTEGECCK